MCVCTCLYVLVREQQCRLRVLEELQVQEAREGATIAISTSPTREDTFRVNAVYLTY